MHRSRKLGFHQGHTNVRRQSSLRFENQDEPTLERLLVRRGAPPASYELYGERSDGSLQLQPVPAEISDLIVNLNSRRSGDVLILLRSGRYFFRLQDLEYLWGVGSSHGSGNGPDLAVPLILAGGGVITGQSTRQVRTVNIAKTVSQYLGFDLECPICRVLDSKHCRITNPLGSSHWRRNGDEFTE